METEHNLDWHICAGLVSTFTYRPSWPSPWPTLPPRHVWSLRSVRPTSPRCPPGWQGDDDGWPLHPVPGRLLVVTWLCTELGVGQNKTYIHLTAQTYEADLNFPLVLVPSNPADERYNLKGMIATECLSIFRNLKHQLSWKNVGCSWWRIRKRTCKRKGNELNILNFGWKS